MKRKIIFLQYILQQEKGSMMYQVLQATKETPSKNDFVETCYKYLKTLNINMTFEEIGQMSKYRFKTLVKEKTKEAAFKYLLEEKSKQTNILDLQYTKLEIQEYMCEGSRNKEIAKVIYKARGKSLDIKTHKKWKYSDLMCIGCGEEVETVDEILSCSGLGKSENSVNPKSNECFFGENVKEMNETAVELKKRLKNRKNIIDDMG